MLDKQPQLLKRKRGSVVRLVVELDFTEYYRFNNAVANLRITKTKATKTAINYWLNSLPKELGS